MKEVVSQRRLREAVARLASERREKTIIDASGTRVYGPHGWVTIDRTGRVDARLVDIRAGRRS